MQNSPPEETENRSQEVEVKMSGCCVEYASASLPGSKPGSPESALRRLDDTPSVVDDFDYEQGCAEAPDEVGYGNQRDRGNMMRGSQNSEPFLSRWNQDASPESPCERLSQLEAAKIYRILNYI